MTPRFQRRLPVEPVFAYAQVRFVGLGSGHPNWKLELARMIGYPRRTILRWQQAGGIPLREADRVACRLGEHPSYFWPDWSERGNDGEGQRLCT